jgi:hypothetical protein
MDFYRCAQTRQFLNAVMIELKNIAATVRLGLPSSLPGRTTPLRRLLNNLSEVCLGDLLDRVAPFHLVFFSLGGPPRGTARPLALPLTPCTQACAFLLAGVSLDGRKGITQPPQPVPSLILGMQLISPEYELFLEGILRS